MLQVTGLLMQHAWMDGVKKDMKKVLTPQWLVSNIDVWYSQSSPQNVEKKRR